MRIVNKFLIGADPEFVVRHGRVVGLQPYVRHEGKLGWDHSGFVGEMRPEPHPSTYEVVQEIQKLIHPMDEGKYGGLHKVGKWIAPPYLEDPARTVTCGGHMHFGLRLWGYEEPYYANNRPVPSAIRKLSIEALDQIGERLAGIDVLQGNGVRARWDSGYGMPSDVRLNGERHFEYRSWPTWLHDPEVALLCLTVGKMAMKYPKSSARMVGEKGFAENPLKALREVMGRIALRSEDFDFHLCVERVLDGRSLVKDPMADFRERWLELPGGKEGKSEYAKVR